MWKEPEEGRGLVQAKGEEIPSSWKLEKGVKTIRVEAGKNLRKGGGGGGQGSPGG